MNKRHAKVFRINQSLAIILPKDWTRGMKIVPGQELELLWGNVLRIRVFDKKGKD